MNDYTRRRFAQALVELGVVGATARSAPLAAASSRPELPAGADAPGGVIDVRQHGATGDGHTDDFPAIAAALDTVRVATRVPGAPAGPILFFPPGVYRVTRPLNLSGGAYTVVGAGPGQSVIAGDTGAGRPVLDCTAARFCSFQGFTVSTAGVQRPSTIGVLFARNDRLAQAGNASFHDVRVDVRTSPRANGGAGTVAFYLCCAEIIDLHSVIGAGDVALYVTGSNDLGVASDYQPVQPRGVAGSMTVLEVGGASSFYAFAGPAIRFRGAASVYVSAYLASAYREVGMASGGRYAIEVLGDLTDFRFRGSVEEFPGFLRVEECLVSDAQLEPYLVRDARTPTLSLAGGILAGGRVDAVPVPGPSRELANLLVQGDPSRPATLRGVHLRLHNQGVDLGPGRLESCVIESTLPLASVHVRAASQLSNTVIAADGVSAGGVWLSQGRLGVGNAAPGTRLGRPVRKVEVFDAAGRSLGFVPVYDAID